MKIILIYALTFLTCLPGFTQSIVNGGSGQGLISLVPEKKHFGYESNFKYIKPEGSLGFWRLRVIPEGISTGLQSLKVSFEFNIDEPRQVRGPNINGGEMMYDIRDFQTTITGRLEYIIEGNYTDPVTKERFTFENKKSTDRFGNTVVKGELFTWGPEVQTAFGKLKINAEADPTAAFLARFNVQITRIEAISRNYSGFEVIDNAVGKRIEEGRKQLRLNNILADARNAEAFKRYGEALVKYQEALALSNDPAIRAKIDEIKALIEAQASSENGQTPDQNSEMPSTADTHNGTPTPTAEKQTHPGYGGQNAAPGSTPGLTAGPSYPAASTPYGSGSFATAENAQDGYDPQAWAKFNESQQRVKQWQQDFDRSIEQGERDRAAKQQYYDQVVSSAMAPLANLLNELERREQQKKINQRKRLIEDALDNAFDPLYADITYWTKFQRRLSAFAETYKNNIPQAGFEALGRAIEGIQGSLEDMRMKERRWREQEKRDWDRVAAENDIFKFPLGAWRSTGHGGASPGIGYELSKLVNSSKFVQANVRANYVNDAATLLSEFAADRQQHEIILSAADQFRASGGTLTRFTELAASAEAIAAYVALRNRIQKEYNEFEETLKTQKGLLAVENSNEHIRLLEIAPLVMPKTGPKGQDAASSEADGVMKTIKSLSGIGPQSKSQGHTMADLFPQIHELSKAYASLKPKMGEFENAYPRYNPERTTDFRAGGYFVEPGEVTLTLSMKYMDPSPLPVKVNIAAGERKTIDIATYRDQLSIKSEFEPFEVDLKKERFKLTKTLIPAKRNRGELKKYKFNLAYTAYNMGISELATTLIGSKSYRNMNSFLRSRTAFFTNVEVLKVSYGMGKITTGYQHTTGAQYFHDILDFNYFGFDLGSAGAGFALGLFNGRSMLELHPSITLMGYKAFSVNATEKQKFTNIEEVASGKYKVGIGNYVVGHAKAALNTRIGNLFLNVEYSHNFYPIASDIDRSIGEKDDDISALSDDYKETHTDFFMNIHKKYFTNNITIYLLF